LVVLVSASMVTPASATDLGMITGREHGTYYQFGQDLKRLVKQSGINLAVHPSNGSVDNIAAVYQTPGIELGIVQSDVLTFIAERQSNAAVTQIANSIRMVFPLYDEEIHIVGRREIGDFEQLAGKRVAVGPAGSGTYLTARLLFKLAAVVPGELVPLDAREALTALKAGQLDAMVYVASSPIGLLKERITVDDGLALIGISHKSVLEAYAPVEIPASVYDWQPTPVSTVAVKAVLVSFDFRHGTCDRVGRFAQLVAGGMDWLAKNGHPKWKQVDLASPLKGWEQYHCVRKYLGKPLRDGSDPAASPGQRNPVADAMKGVLGPE
jgi:TRAP transporter TAXI family solute receptor